MERIVINIPDDTAPKIIRLAAEATGWSPTNTAGPDGASLTRRQWVTAQAAAWLTNLVKSQARNERRGAAEATLRAADEADDAEDLGIGATDEP